MKRSTYSLILMDDVVAAIDLLAEEQGKSRSNYINQILAEHVQCITPEQRMQRLFSCLSRQMNASLRVQEQGSDAMLSILGAVQYKYRPTIRYRVELLRDLRKEEIGQLQISCRTQSQTLLQAMDCFFQFWVKLECAYYPESACGQGLYQIQNGRMKQALLRHGVSEEEDLGNAVGNYICMLHAVLQSYFTGLQQQLPAPILYHTLEQQYRSIQKNWTRTL